MPRRRRESRGRATRSALWLIVSSALVLLVAPAAWWTTDSLEADDDFCNSCHLPSGSPLHIEIREDFDARPPASLAARHGDFTLPNRPDSPRFLCIDCHGGVGFIGRARIKLLSAKDSMLYISGRFKEPEETKWPLLDRDCQQCHESFQEKEHGFDGEAFHNMPLHNVGLGVDCVDCHTLHAAGQADLWFLEPDRVRLRCAQCHVEYAQP